MSEDKFKNLQLVYIAGDFHGEWGYVNNFINHQIRLSKSLVNLKKIYEEVKKKGNITMNIPKDYSHFINKVFGRLTVLSQVSWNMHDKHVYFNCRCSCNNLIVMRIDHLRDEKIISCGCYNRERLTTHAESHTRIYHIWGSMKQRCLNENNPAYMNYGGRNINICDEWCNNYIEFRDRALNNGYEENLSIDRINNDGDYEPSNCRWVTEIEQANNKRNNIVLPNGQTLAQHCKNDINLYKAIYARIQDGWAMDDAINIPIGEFFNKNLNIRHK